MKTFSFVVKDDFFPQTYVGTIKAKTRGEAVRQIKEEYAVDLDTTPDCIEILEFIEEKN